MNILVSKGIYIYIYIYIGVFSVRSYIRLGLLVVLCSRVNHPEYISIKVLVYSAHNVYTLDHNIYKSDILLHFLKTHCASLTLHNVFFTIFPAS
jgi:hypothetical protein